jgi:hypothetical protein
VTAVRIQTTPARCSVVFGSPSELQATSTGKLAIFGPEKIVAYFAQRSPWQALYLFRTSPPPGSATCIRGVSEPVSLLYVAQTRRTVDKTNAALHVLKRRIGEGGIDALPEIFWLRLADFIERRGQKILYYVTRLLEYEPAS